MKNTIIIPTYNERENIKVLIPLIFKLLPDIKVVVADDNSPDGTAKLIEEFKGQYPNISVISRQKKDGLAKAYINAFSKILPDKDVKSIIMMDADFAPQLKYFPEMLKKSNDYQVVIGSRYVQGGKTIGFKLPRRILSYLGNLYCRLILPVPIKDYSCGYVVISTELMRKIDLSKINASGYSFISELKYLLYKAGGTFFEVPITLMGRTQGESKFSFHILWEGIFTPWRIIMKK